jgi:hypothetical protein
MRGFAVRIDGPLGVAIDRPHGSDACEFDRTAMLRRVCQHLRCRQDGGHAALGTWDGHYQVDNRGAQRGQADAMGEHDRLFKAAIPGHNATPQQNRDSSGHGPNMIEPRCLIDDEGRAPFVSGQLRRPRKMVSWLLGASGREAVTRPTKRNGPSAGGELGP